MKKQALSYSVLKSFLPETIEFNGQSKGVHYGSIVDCLLTEPDKFNFKYKISKNYMDLTDEQNKLKNVYMKSYIIEKNHNLAYKATYDFGFSLWKTADTIKKHLDLIIDFVKEQCEFLKLILISEKDYEKCVEIVQLIKSTKGTSKYTTDSSEQIEVKYQYHFEIPMFLEKRIEITHFKYKELLNNYPFFLYQSSAYSDGKETTTKYYIVGYKVHGYIDRLEINHEKNTMRITDFKTTKESLILSKIKETVNFFNYDLQAYVYSEFLKTLSSSNHNYKIEPYNIVIASTTRADLPLSIEFSEETLLNGKNKKDIAEKNIINMLVYDNEFKDSVYVKNGYCYLI